MLYKAFISYSHAADGKLAPALHSALHRFARPWYKPRAFRVFRDNTNLSVRPHLWAAIETALGEAEHFILLCSPEAAASKWVQREVAFWLSKRGADTLLLVLTDGDIVWDGKGADFDWQRTTALPHILSGVYSDEPLFLDLRAARTSTDLSLDNPAFRDMVADLSATLHGISKDEIVGDDIRQHRRTKRVAWSAAAALVVLTLLSGMAGWIAKLQRDEAVSQRARAEENFREAAKQREEARWERDRAVAQQRIAESRELAARTLLVVDTDPVEALQLAVQAAQLDKNGSTQTAIRTALRASHAAAMLDGDARGADAVFTLNGQRLVTGGSHGLRFWDLGFRENHLTLTHPVTLDPRQYSQVVASLEGRRVAAVSGNTVSVWDVGTGQLLLRFSEPSVQKIAHVGLSADGLQLVAVYGASVGVWNIEDQQRIYQVSGSILAHADIRPSDQSIAAASTDGHSVQLWRIPTGERISLSTGGPAHTVEFSPDGAWLVATSEGSGLRLWNVAGSGPPVAVGADPKERSAEGLIRCARFHRAPGTLRLATGGADGVVRVWEPSQSERALWMEVANLRGHLKPVLGVEFDTTGERMVSVSEDGTARIWWRHSLSPSENPTWAPLTVLRGHRTPVTRGQFTPDGRWVLTIGADALILISDPSHDREVGTFGLLRNGVKDVDLDQKGGRIVGMFDSGPLMLWSVRDDGSRRVGTRSPWRARFSPDGDGLLTADVENVMVLYDTVSGEPKATFQGHENSISSIQFDRTGKMIVTTGNDDTVRLWEASSGALLRTLRGPQMLPEDAFFSPDGRLVASVWWNGQTWVWTRQGESEAQLQGVRGATGGTFSADGRQLFVSGYGSVRVWDTNTWSSGQDVTPSQTLPSVTAAGWPYVAFGYNNGSVEVVGVGEDRSRRQWTEHTASVKVAAFSADGRWLLTGDKDGAVRLWDVVRGTLLARLHDHAGEIRQLRFSGDGRVWLSLGQDGTVRVNYRRLEDLVELAKARFPERIRSTD
jgi:WD40 repeat protein